MQCANHPAVETYVRCNKCDTPICPRCSVESPIGLRCKSCTRQDSPLRKASPAQYLRATAAALIAGAALGWMALFVFWLGAVYGYLVAEVMMRASGRRRSLGMQVIAGVGALLGVLLWRLPGFATGHLALNPPVLMAGLASAVCCPVTLIAIGLGVFFAVSHVRYL